MAKLTKGKKVEFNQPRTGATLTARIKEIVETLRGVWYVLKTDPDGRIIKARAGNLTLL